MGEAPLVGTLLEDEASPDGQYIVLCPVPDFRAPAKIIETPEGSLAVTPMLHDAISTLRRMADGQISIWTSEISINQKNDGEKWSSFRMMESIYKNARQVVAYLGADDEDTGDAHELFDTLACLDLSKRPTSIDGLAQAGLPPVTDGSWRAIDKFLSRSWFRSMHALPACYWATSLQFVGEQWSLDSEAFVIAMLKANALRMPLFGHGQSSDDLVAGVRTFTTFSGLRVRHRAGETHIFSYLLPKCRLAQADTPLEKLALLAATSNEGSNEVLWNSVVEGSGVDDQALRIVRFFFDSGAEDVELLCQARGCVDSYNLSSWMPDILPRKRDRSKMISDKFRTAAFEGPRKPIISDGGRTLKVYCAPVPCACPGHNSIVAVTRYTSGGGEHNAAPDYRSLVSQWHHAQGVWNAMRNETGEPLTSYRDGSDPLDAIWETLLKGNLSDPEAVAMTESMTAARAIFMAIRGDDILPVLTENFELAREAMDYLAEQLEGWRLCALPTGHIALVPEEAAVGDVIMAIHGARVPFVFRPVAESDDYSIIGECYVHGVMNGELLSRQLGFSVVALT
jgi:hypothetical protein